MKNGSKTSPQTRSQQHTTLPSRIRVRREKGYHTDAVGTFGAGRQFMAFVIGVPSGSKQGARYGLAKWYAVMHLFEPDGRYESSKWRFLGTASFASELEETDAQLHNMIRDLGPVEYRDIEVELFSTLIDGHVFGLVNATQEGSLRVELVPNNLMFFPPWDGTYST